MKALKCLLFHRKYQSVIDVKPRAYMNYDKGETGYPDIEYRHLWQCSKCSYEWPSWQPNP